jgi:hypothetical protein
MRRRLQDLMLRLRRAWRQAGAPFRRPTRPDRPEPGNAARARFWAEFREGQREADARGGDRS